MQTLTRTILLVASLALLSGCQPQEAPAEKQSTAKPSTSGSAPSAEENIGMPSVGEPAGSAANEATPKPTQKAGEVVFDPANPPPGFTRCHRNHCHRKGGGVASYRQVMQEIGATKMVGQQAAPEMPAAPPDVAAPPADAEKTASGLASKVLSEGSGTTNPGPASQVTVHYTGWTTDGKPFDSSLARGKPATFPLNRVIPGWTEGLQLMVEGEERRFWIPSELAYNNKPGRPAGMLVFDVMLIDIVE